MDNGCQQQGYIEEQIERCEEIEQQLAIPEFNNWITKEGLSDIHKSSWSKIAFTVEELNLYNQIHEYKFHIHNNKIVRFWFTGSCGEVNFASVGLKEFLEQNEYNFHYTYFMHLFLSIFTLGLHRKIIPWLINRRKKKYNTKISKLRTKIQNWKPGDA